MALALIIAPMRVPLSAAVSALALGLLAACQPALNWRDVRLDNTPLRVQLPCKPDRASRAVAMAGQNLQLHVAGCDAGGATFAVMQADLPQPQLAAVVLAQWRQATLLNMRATSLQDAAFVPTGAYNLPQSLLTQAVGRRPAAAGGAAVQARAVWFSNGAQVFHAVLYADAIEPAVADTFFASLVLQ